MESTASTKGAYLCTLKSNAKIIITLKSKLKKKLKHMGGTDTGNDSKVRRNALGGELGSYTYHVCALFKPFAYPLP